MSQFEHFIRDDLNTNARRAMCVLKPVLVTFVNYDSEGERFTVPVHPQREELGSRTLPFGRQVYIDANDFSEDTSLSRKKFKRLVIGDYVRLRGAYIIRAEQVVRDSDNNIQEIKASIVPNTVGADAPEGIKPRGVIHWVSAVDALDCTVNLYDRLFADPEPDAGDKNFLDHINPDSLEVIEGCKAEASLGSR
jgi:glutaminyl-tRNA synthetase